LKTVSVPNSIEHRQLDFIQRVGRIGYWEYASENRSLSLSNAALGLLASILGGPPHATRPLMAAMSGAEQARWQSALDDAVAKQQTLHIDLKLARYDGQPAYIAVQGAPVDATPGSGLLAGTFQDTTTQRRREADHEEVITQLQALLDALPQAVSVVDKDLRLIVWNKRVHDILNVPHRLIFRHARFEDIIRYNAARGDYGPGDPAMQVKAIVDRARQFLPHRFERELKDGRTLQVEGFPFKSGGEVSGFVTTYTDITEQKRAEEQLTRQHDVMKTIIDNFPGAISLFDTDLNLIVHNEQLLELLELPQTLFDKSKVSFEDLVRFNVARGEYGPGDPQEQVAAILARAQNFQAHCIERARPNGRWLEIHGIPLASGGFVTSYFDITQRKKAEEALRNNEERWKFALEGANDGVWDWNFQTGEVMYSKRWKEMFGYSESEIDNTPEAWLNRVHPDDGENLVSIIERHLYSMAQAPSVEHRFLCKDGTWKWTLGRGMVVSRDSKGKPLRIVGTNSDISERKKAEEALKSSEERWKFALEGANDGVWDWDFESKIVLYSKRWKEMFGYEDSEIGTSRHEWLGRVHPDEFDRVIKVIETHIFNRAPAFSVEYRFRCKDGSWKWTVSRGMVVSRDGAGNALRLVGTNSDISERKRIEAELVQSKEVAEASREQVARLLDNSGQGFLSFGSSLLIDTQYSLACESMLGQSPAGRNAAELFFPADAVKADLFRSIIASVLDESEPDTRDVMLSLLPTEIKRDSVILQAQYKALENRKFMVVLTDITAERRMADLLRSERQRLELIVMAVSDSRNFFETIEAFREFLSVGLVRSLQREGAAQVIAKDLYREIHTYKGLLSQFSFPDAPKALHDTETRLSGLLSLGEALTRHQLVQFVSPQALQTPFDSDLAILSDALGDDFLTHGESITLSDAQARQLEALAARLLRGESVDTSSAELRSFLREIGTLRKVSLRDVLMGFDGLVRQTAKRMEKEVAPIEVAGGNNVWIDPDAYRPFFHALVHVFRNAVAHGLETPEARWEAEKDEAGRITCNIAVQGNTLRLSIADDGAGINLDTLRQRAVSAGVYSISQIDMISDDTIAQLIFMDHMSTQTEVSELSGRGIGLAAVLNETKNQGGSVIVRTRAGQGTEFVFTLPLLQDNPNQRT
jgi:PAS domain S-box-containing protein